MAATIRGTPVFDGTNATTTASSRAPAITSGTVSGELMVVAICWSGSTVTLTDPTGWNLLHKTVQTNDNLATYYRYFVGGDIGPTLTLSAVCTCIACNITFTGAVTSGAPVSANVLGGAAGTTATYPAITPAHADDLLVYLPGIRPATASLQPTLSTLPAGGTGGTVTQVAFNSTNVSGAAESALGIITQQLTAATAVSQETSTISTSSSCDCEALCIAAAPVGGAPQPLVVPQAAVMQAANW